MAGADVRNAAILSRCHAELESSDEPAHAACHDADLALPPPLGDYASTDFKHVDPIPEMAFRYASERVAEWAAR